MTTEKRAWFNLAPARVGSRPPRPGSVALQREGRQGEVPVDGCNAQAKNGRHADEHGGDPVHVDLQRQGIEDAPQDAGGCARAIKLITKS